MNSPPVKIGYGIFEQLNILFSRQNDKTQLNFISIEILNAYVYSHYGYAVSFSFGQVGDW